MGGLLWVCNFQSPIGTHFAAYDGNGNVVGLVSATTGTETACYEFGPFGEPIRVTGSAAALNPFRFSTKRTDNTTDVVLYEYRVYNPSTGRWPLHDPIGEHGGLNLYGMLGNNPVNLIDAFGLWTSWPNGGKHDTLTRNSLNTALAALTPPLSSKCKKKITETLVAANVSQDRDSAADDLSRHFNRTGFATETAQEVQQQRTEARNAYEQYLQNEEVSFNYIPECWERLKALRRLSHSWQDYYDHGVHTSQGFVDPITGSPSSFTDFWPSSYPGGHKDNWTEPISVSSRRFRQAEAYVARRFRRMLKDWLASCRCICER